MCRNPPPPSFKVLDHHDRFLRERGLPPLCALATSEDWSVKGEATRALANLASNAEIQGALLAEGVLLNLVATLRCHEENCQKYAALCLANLATTTALQTKVRVCACFMLCVVNVHLQLNLLVFLVKAGVTRGTKCSKVLYLTNFHIIRA